MPWTTTKQMLIAAIDELSKHTFEEIGKLQRLIDHLPEDKGGGTMKVILNTYPKFPNCPHAEAGDEVRWERGRLGFSLIRLSDGKCVFTTAPVDRDGSRYSNGKPPILIGVIAEVKSKGWVLEVEYEKAL